MAGEGGMGGSSKIWGPKPAQSAPVRHGTGMAVGEASLGGAVGHLHAEHPNHVQGEGLQHKAEGKIHHHVTSSVYGGNGR